MDKTEMKTLDIAALSKEAMLLKKELFNLKLSLISGQVKDLSQFKKLRAKIARTLTYLNQKKNAAEEEGKD